MKLLQQLPEMGHLARHNSPQSAPVMNGAEVVFSSLFSLVCEFVCLQRRIRMTLKAHSFKKSLSLAVAIIVVKSSG